MEGELRELTNALNEWRGGLRRWCIWLDVLDAFDEDDAWALQWEFVESIAFQCLFYPSATRDRFTFVATNALHQVRMATEPAYRDRLASDSKPGRENTRRFLSRADSETQLEKISALFDGADAFMAALRSIDEYSYIELTRNFRNLASHAIAPRMSVGYTSMVVRRVEAAVRLVQQPDGTCEEELIPGKQVVSYDFGGTAPLQMRTVFEANLAEFVKASACFTAYVSVFNKALAVLPRRGSLQV